MLSATTWLLGGGGAVALASVALSWRATRLAWPRLLLLLASFLGAAVWALAVIGQGSAATVDARFWLTGVAAAVAWWFLVFRPPHRSTQVTVGAILAIVMAITLFVASPSVVGVSGQVLFSLVQVARLLAVSVLVFGVLWAWAPDARSRTSVARATSTGALLWQTLALLLYAVRAQQLWGSYWRWTAWECWQLAVWAAIALLVVGSREMAWDKGLALSGVLLAAALALLVLLGSAPILGLLGQPVPMI